MVTLQAGKSMSRFVFFCGASFLYGQSSYIYLNKYNRSYKVQTSKSKTESYQISHGPGVEE